MHIVLPTKQKETPLLCIEKYVNNKKVQTKSAFSGNTAVEIRAVCSRRLGITEACLVLRDDVQNEETQIELVVTDTAFGRDCFSVKLDFSKLCKQGDGLFYWYLVLRSADKVMYASSVNNEDACIVTEEQKVLPFRILVYREDFKTPDWAKKSVMYQIFTDRFNRGKGNIPCREDAVVIEDWYGGIPEYPPYNGAPMKNNSFFGGNLYGVIEKLDYLQSLGVNLLYFCPIFKAYSNHKYDTGDYETVDEMFGGDEAFDSLVRQCNKRGIRIILDGVFNHTGDDSKYFNKYGKYKNAGAYQSKDSEYYGWYNFTDFPNKYEAWWGIEILPRIDGSKKQVKEYFLSQNGIVRKWLKRGVSGWRLDVADELSRDFLEGLRLAAKTEKEDSLIIGEVWENAADKVSYGERRGYFRGKQLDSVMNYPVKDAIIEFVKHGDGEKFYNCITEIYSSYPDFCSSVLMNMLGSHDTPRILTVLGGENPDGYTNAELSTKRMSEEERSYGKKLLKLAAVLQFTLPGIPSVYYGDEAGVEGYHDPFCRLPYPWGKEDNELVEYYTRLCHIKLEQKSLSDGELSFVCCDGGLCVYERQDITVAVNASGGYVSLETVCDCTDLLTGKEYEKSITLSPLQAVILKKI